MPPAGEEEGVVERDSVVEGGYNALVALRNGVGGGSLSSFWEGGKHSGK